MQMRARIRNKHGLEILFGIPLNTGIGPVKRQLPSTDHFEDEMLHYCANLSSVLSNIHRQVKEILPVAVSGPLHDFKPGDWIVVKDFRKKNWQSRRWTGLFQVLLTTQTAVKVAERATATANGSESHMTIFILQFTIIPPRHAQAADQREINSKLQD